MKVIFTLDDSGNFLAGDERVNENAALIAMHTLFVREHNRLCDELKRKKFRNLDDERLYQLARRYVAGMVQAITYNEYLPALLGPKAVRRYSGYKKKVDPSVSNVFSNAAFRFGHTTVSETLLRLDNDANVIPAGNLALKDAFFNPSLVNSYEDIGYLLKGQSAQVMQEIDTKVISGLRNFLFGAPGAGGLDLFSINLQRGRGHGLPDYNTFRAAFGLSTRTSFNQITSDTELATNLNNLCGSVDELDVWIGILAEDHAEGASIGELGVAIIADQFTRLRDADRFWYKKAMPSKTARWISKTTLSKLIQKILKSLT